MGEYFWLGGTLARDEWGETDCCFAEVSTPPSGDGAAAHWRQLEDEGNNVLLFGALQSIFTRSDAVSAFKKYKHRIISNFLELSFFCVGYLKFIFSNFFFKI